jgi:hypothetical protein
MRSKHAYSTVLLEPVVKSIPVRPDCARAQVKLSTHRRPMNIFYQASNRSSTADQLRGPQTGFETMSDHTDRGVGRRQCGTSQTIKTLQRKNNASTS